MNKIASHNLVKMSLPTEILLRIFAESRAPRGVLCALNSTIRQILANDADPAYTPSIWTRVIWLLWRGRDASQQARILPEEKDAIDSSLVFARRFSVILASYPDVAFQYALHQRTQLPRAIDTDSASGWLCRHIIPLQQLQELNLTGAHLTSLSQQIGKLCNLQVLYLNENMLTELPKEIGTLKKLTHLQLAHNRLSTLPAEMGKLSNLIALFVYENPLRSTPIALAKLRAKGRLTICFGAVDK